MQKVVSLWNSNVGGKILITFAALVSLCVCAGGAGSLLRNDPPAPTVTPPATATIQQFTNTPISSPTITLSPTATNVPLNKYRSFATARFGTLQETLGTLITVHNEFIANMDIASNPDWNSRAKTILGVVTSTADELASLTNYPPEYEAFHQKTILLSQEGKALFSNYMLALDNRDTAALNSATVNLGNMIAYLNDANVLIVSLQPTAIPSKTATATATTIYIQPTAAFTNYDRNGDGKVTCKDFSTQAAAQQAYNAGYTNLDGSDNDGKACETLP